MTQSLMLPSGEPAPSESEIMLAPVESYGQKRTVRFFNNPFSQTSAEEILLGRTYPLLICFGEIQTIVDVGANVGASTLYFSLVFPTARILAFEPSARSYSLLVRNTLSEELIRTFNFGLLDRNEVSPLFLGERDSINNSLYPNALTSAATAMAEFRCAAEVLEQNEVASIDLLKVSAEGCELKILQSLKKWLPTIGVIYVACHDETDRLEIDRMLTETHVLSQGRVLAPHRADLCYVAKSRLTPEHEANRIVKNR